MKCIRQEANPKQIQRGIRFINEVNDELESTAVIYQLLGSPTRLKILLLLNEEKALCVCDLSDILSISIPAVSQHLKKLRDRGLVRSDQQAQTIFYSVGRNANSLVRSIKKLPSKVPA